MATIQYAPEPAPCSNCEYYGPTLGWISNADYAMMFSPRPTAWPRRNAVQPTTPTTTSAPTSVAVQGSTSSTPSSYAGKFAPQVTYEPDPTASVSGNGLKFTITSGYTVYQLRMRVKQVGTRYLYTTFDWGQLAYNKVGNDHIVRFGGVSSSAVDGMVIDIKLASGEIFTSPFMLPYGVALVEKTPAFSFIQNTSTKMWVSYNDPTLPIICRAQFHRQPSSTITGSHISGVNVDGNCGVDWTIYGTDVAKGSNGLYPIGMYVEEAAGLKSKTDYVSFEFVHFKGVADIYYNRSGSYAVATAPTSTASSSGNSSGWVWGSSGGGSSFGPIVGPTIGPSIGPGGESFYGPIQNGANGPVSTSNAIFESMEKVKQVTTGALTQTADVSRIVSGWQSNGTPQMTDGIAAVKGKITEASDVLKNVKIGAFTTIAILAAGERLASESSTSTADTPSAGIKSVVDKLKSMKASMQEAAAALPTSLDPAMEVPTTPGWWNATEYSNNPISLAHVIADRAANDANEIKDIIDKEKGNVKDMAFAKYVNSPVMSVTARKLCDQLTGITPNFAIFPTLHQNGKCVAPVEIIEGRTNYASLGKLNELTEKEQFELEQGFISESQPIVAAASIEGIDHEGVSLSTIKRKLSTVTASVSAAIAGIINKVNSPAVKQINMATVDDINSTTNGKDFDTNLRKAGSPYTFAMLMEYKLVREVDLIPLQYKMSWIKLRLAEEYQKTLTLQAPNLVQAKQQLPKSTNAVSSFFSSAKAAITNPEIINTYNTMTTFTASADIINDYMTAMSVFWSTHTSEYFVNFPANSNLAAVWPPVPPTLQDAIIAVNNHAATLASKGIAYPPEQA